MKFIVTNKLAFLRWVASNPVARLKLLVPTLLVLLAIAGCGNDECNYSSCYEGTCCCTTCDSDNSHCDTFCN